MVALLPVLVLVAGALMFGISSNATVKELGRLMFAAGIFALCFALSTKTVTLLH